MAERGLVCCESLVDALAWDLLEKVNGELVLQRRPLTEVRPDATAGNVLTGETYDPAEFSLTMALTFCPFCGIKWNEEAEAQADADVEMEFFD